MHIIDGDGGGTALPFDSNEKSRLFAAASQVILKSLPLGSNPDAVRDPTAFKNELLLAWTLACSAHRDEFPGNCDWGYILPDGSLQRQSFRIDNASLQPESTTSQALSGIKECEASAETQERSPGSRLFFGHRPDLLKPEPVGTGVGDEDSLYLEVSVTDKALEVTGCHSTGAASSDVDQEVNNFIYVLKNVLENPDRKLGDLLGATSKDLELLWSWNQEVPPLLQTCVHDIISDVARKQPDAIAVQSWGGILTYNELDELSTLLAQHLRFRGVDIGTRIPLCFEKSMWAIVALLGVMKAGATFSLTDPSQPEARLRTIVEQTGAEIVITSVAQSQLGQRITNNGQVITVSRDFFEATQEVPTDPLPEVPSSSPMYVIFTSGSTGKPKGVIISHENYTSGAIPRAQQVGYTAGSRCFDFPSYAFDVSIDCMLCTLFNGGRVCVPSDEQRMNDLSGAIRESKANMVHMTPSVARVLDADIIPSLEVLGLGGEAVGASDAADWSKHTKLVIAYGPSECTVGCTINNTLEISTGIGKGVGGVSWIVDPDDYNRLTPVGSVGELIMEGPVVGIGYLGEPEKTAEVFIEDPTWLLAGYGDIPGRHGRLYKTGDLVRYESKNPGSIEFVGRKDQQVKLRGQRVELAEVEHHIRECLPPQIKVAAEVLKPEDGAPTLVAFLVEPGFVKTADTGDLFIEPSAELSSALSTIEKTMGAEVPRYMVPAAFITLQYMPSLVSGKIDRKKLREIGNSIPREKFGRLQSIDRQEEDPENETEKQLQRAWNKVLGSEVNVYRQGNFFSLGGDSLRAMRLVAAAREEGLTLTVADIFSNTTLIDMAQKTVQASETPQEGIAPFSLIDADWDPETARVEAGELCGIEPDAIEDIYLCTPLQEALMALSAKVKEAYVAQRVVELQDIATAQRLIAAFDTAQQDCPILRTRIVQASGRGLVQVVVKGKPEWYSGSNLDEYLVQDRDEAMDLGKPLVRYAVIPNTETGTANFVLTMHHALYDGWAMPLIAERVNTAYKDQTLTRPAEFKHFIKYLKEMDRTGSETFWRERLDGANGPQFPALPWSGYQAAADSLLEVYVSLEHPPVNTTTATVIRAAWAFVVSQYINSGDIVFGETLTGRNAPIVGSEEIEGPMITTIPIRVQVDHETTVSEYLQDVQEQFVAQIPHEHFGLQHIRRLSPDALEACELRTGLVLHPSTAGEEESGEDLPANRLVSAGDDEAAQEALKFNTYALMLVCSIDPKGFLVMASFDAKTVAKPLMERILNQLKQTAQLLTEKAHTPLGELAYLTEDNMNDLRELFSNATSDKVLREYSGTQAAYIVDPHDSERILPKGAVGELVVRSDAELDLPAIETVTWLSTLHGEKAAALEGKVYKTGKLAKFNADGHIEFTGQTSKTNAGALTQRRPARRVSAISRKQRKLRGLWSRVLRIPEEDIGLNDNFFLRGGDSIAAMKLVSEARLAGAKLTVIQIFQKRSLYEMANVMEETEISTQAVEELPAFSLLGVENARAFVEEVVRPQLADPNWKVTNVLPARPLQEVAVQGTVQIPRFSTRYELIYFDSAVDRPKLMNNCRELVSRNEILRTVFIEHEGQGYGVVIEGLEAEFAHYEVDADVEIFAKQLCQLDVLTKMPLGSCFVKWFLVEGANGQPCLLFRISHAQYDEICLPMILRQLSALYEDKPVQDTIPFSSYVGHVVCENIPKAVEYWRELLEGSSITTFRPDIPVERKNHFAIQKAVDISSRSRDITVATLPTAAWALCLAKRLSVRDVTFGEVVSGRNIDFPNADAVMGPCWQYVPVRVKFSPAWTVADLLGHVQDQHIATSAHEGIGLKELVKLCTDWPSTVDWYDTVVHQDVEHVETLDFQTASSRMETVYVHEEPLREWKIQAFVSGEQLTLEIVTVESWGEYAKGLLDDLADVMTFLVQDRQALLFKE
ncbi:Fc.00g031040.m01.CDS01 [Cosmosporella sp. VM-42]